MIGPSGCGKSTFLRTLNRINETIKSARYDGEVLLDGQNVLGMDVTAAPAPHGNGIPAAQPVSQVDFRQRRLRLRVNGLKGKQSLAESVEHSLRAPRYGTKSRTS